MPTKKKPAKAAKKAAAPKKAGGKPEAKKPSAEKKSAPKKELAKSATVEIVTPLTPEEAKRRVELEGVISAGVTTFKAVGEALAEISNKRLYRQDYPTFQQYCEKEWKFGADYAFRLIRGSETAALVEKAGLPAPKSEAAVRSLSSLPPEKREEAYREASEESGGGAPNATAVKKAVEKRAAKAPASKLDVFGFSSELLEKDTKLADALKKIGKALGEDIQKAITIGSIEMKRPDVFTLASMTPAQMKEMEPLIVTLRWSVKRASSFLASMPDEESKVIDLINHCIANNGNYEATVDGYKITVTGSKAKKR